MKASIRFLGGAGTVTGSKFLLELGSNRVLVDCGLFQGLKDLRLQNWAPLAIEPSSISAVLLTHAHLDHAGYLPVLARNGFGGPIHCSEPTRDLAKAILMDSAKIQEEDADSANRLGYSKHHPARPLYTTQEVLACLQQFKIRSRDEWHELVPGARFRFLPSGHILGSVFVEVEWEGKRILFTGDLGRSDPLLLDPPRSGQEADFVIIESTYGDRNHPPISPLKELGRIIRETHERRGHLVVPAFAVGRTQDLLYLISQLKAASQIPNVPVFLDSPMGINATEIFADHPEWHRLSPEECQALCDAATLVKSQQQSEELLRRKDSSIVIAGSGMLSGGRVLQHLERRLPDDRNTILIVGYQPASTRGRLLLDGVTEIKIQGQYVPVRAKIEEIGVLSAHADQRDLIEWMRKLRKEPRKIFIVHGEPQAADCLRVRVKDELGWSSSVAKPGSEEELN